MRRTVAIEIISFSFIVLFTYAAVSKLVDAEQFKVQLGLSPLLTTFADEIVWLIPGAEIAIAVMLAIHKLRIIALHASFNLMVMFTSYIVAILEFSDFVPCSCGGVLSQLGWTEHLIFNVAFAILAIIGVLLLSKDSRGKFAKQIN